MTPSPYFPISSPFLMVLALLLAAVVFLVELRILGYAYHELGIGHRWVFALLALSLLGSSVNIPIAELPAEVVHSGELVTFFGVQYVIPVTERLPRTLIAVNLGGAVIPTLLSLYLLARKRLWGKGLVAVALVVVVVHRLATPVPGVGIALPVFVPPLVAAAVALLLSRRDAGPLAYASGSLGTLIGADLLNLGRVEGLGAPVASIGGAGTFDGIFVTGILAVVLASLFGGGVLRPQRAPTRHEPPPPDEPRAPVSG